MGGGLNKKRPSAKEATTPTTTKADRYGGEHKGGCNQPTTVRHKAGSNRPIPNTAGGSYLLQKKWSLAASPAVLPSPERQQPSGASTPRSSTRRLPYPGGGDRTVRGGAES